MAIAIVVAIGLAIVVAIGFAIVIAIGLAIAVTIVGRLAIAAAIVVRRVRARLAAGVAHVTVADVRVRRHALPARRVDDGVLAFVVMVRVA